MDAEKHVQEKERLNQALNGKLTQAVDDIKDALRRNNIEYSAGIAVDVFMQLKNCTWKDLIFQGSYSNGRYLHERFIAFGMPF